MADKVFDKINREVLYNEIWEISAAGAARKYNIPYTELLRLCKEAKIPIPPSGYWTKLSFGKPVEKIQLPEHSEREVILPINNSEIIDYTYLTSSENIDSKNDGHNKLRTEDAEENLAIEVDIKGDNTNPVYPSLSNKLNEHNRKKLYDEEEVKMVTHKKLSFLSEHERRKVLLASEQIQLSDEKEKLHKKIREYHPKVREWNKNDRKEEGAQKSFKNYSTPPPFLAGVISNETLPRIHCILNTLYRQIELLGGSINDDLSLTIRNERVTLKIFEAQDEVKHELTRQEAQELVAYEDKIRHDKWAIKPNIRKYDYVFNGKLRIAILKNKYFRDSEKEKIESRLDDMLIDLYEESEIVRKKREADEEDQRKRDEEKRLREERENRYREEAVKTIALTNIAQDYDMACKIRVYIEALKVRADLNDETTAEWIDWAKKKADWFDPIIAREDELFGKREHEKSEEQKVLKKHIGYWW